MCQHEQFCAETRVARLTDVEGGPVTGFHAEIVIKCAQCGKPFQFLGLEPGYDSQGARVSIDGLAAQLAIVPEGVRPNPLHRLAFGVTASH